jgi:hypothetical protein
VTPYNHICKNTTLFDAPSFLKVGLMQSSVLQHFRMASDTHFEDKEYLAVCCGWDSLFLFYLQSHSFFLGQFEGEGVTYAC